MSNQDDDTLTGHYRSDIIMLSSMLNGQRAGLPSIDTDRTDSKLTLLTHISAILTIGDDKSPLAQSVHTVSGQINHDKLECLVCAENTGQALQGGNTSVPGMPEPGSVIAIEGVRDAARGAQLLQEWSEDP